MWVSLRDVERGYCELLLFRVLLLLLLLVRLREYVSELGLEMRMR